MAAEETQSSSALSERELQIVELVAGGLTNQEIAEKLEISKRTVDNHISNILTKTTTGNRVALVRWALQWGKVCIDEVNCCTLPAPDEAVLAEPTVDANSTVTETKAPANQATVEVEAVEEEVAPR
ncbi:helix-turn-helix domain-containing protein [Leptolyngbya sp. AN02str]|uniref:photosynthetic electron transport-dependent transcriptional regulator PedR n=1 Tax=Leptolyngbya sp. AN02str TaxID=3423363 RepID=UPI003D3100E2